MNNPRLSPLSTPSATRAVLERHGLYTKYGLGQNFLVNDDVVRKILELADVGPEDHVLEVGPGIGTLTAALLQRAARVTAIEKDADLPAVLEDTLSPWANRFRLLSMDALDARGADLALPGPGAGGPSAGRQPANGRLDADAPDARPADPAQAGPGDGIPSAGCAPVPNKLVSNLPYSVAATVVLAYLQRFDFLESATVMVQKEVADRMAAVPGSKVYGAYTVKLGLYARPAGRFPVAPGNFFPPPHVESAVIRLDRAVVHAADGSRLSPELLSATCTMADAAFATRRKTLANSCKTYFANRPEVQDALPELFAAAGIDPRRRGETLTQAEFIQLGRALLDSALP